MGDIRDGGPLVVVNGYGVFIYAGTGDTPNTLVDHVLTRNDPDSGFVQMTALSHVGPAVDYLAALAQDGNDDYKTLLGDLLERIKATRKALQADPDWQSKLDAPGWNGFTDQINAMTDYGLWMAGDYLVKVRDGKVSFTQANVGNDFYNAGIADYKIPFGNIMIATFMLVDLNSTVGVRGLFETNANLDWKNARVLVHMAIGTNYGAGLTMRTNQLAHAVKVLSGGAVGSDNILIAPYANAPCPGETAGSGCSVDDFTAATLDKDVYDFYSTNAWWSIYDRTQIAQNAFPNVQPIKPYDPPQIPGDYSVTKADDIDAFMQRLQNSLVEKTELLSNTVGYWMPDELAAKGWDPAKVDIPGLTAGLPDGVTAYPTDLPAIPD